MTVHERLYRSLLVAYPADHRREYGESMTQLFRDRLRDEGGGMRTAAVWVSVALDLVKSALSERTETTMESFKSAWWRMAAGFIAFAIATFGILNLFGEDGGALYGKVVAASIALVIAGAIFVGLMVRRRNKVRGGNIIALATLPGVPLIVLFWLPPVALTGLLCAFVAWKAFSDANAHRRIEQKTAEAT